MPRRSNLQAKILMRLESSPAPTITALADAIHAQRPAVSRALKSLQAQDLVGQNCRGWQLTLHGREQAIEVVDKLNHTIITALDTLSFRSREIND